MNIFIKSYLLFCCVHRFKVRLLITVVSVLMISSCAVSKITRSSDKQIIDQPLGANSGYTTGSKLILITIAADYHIKMSTPNNTQSAADTPPGYSQFLERMRSTYGLTRVADWPLNSINIYCIVFKLTSTEARESVVAALNNEPSIETAQAVQSFAVQGASNYNDPLFSLQHGLASLQVADSHRWSRGEGVRVAVVDTGSDTAHPELKKSIDKIRNFVDKDDVTFRSDVHGTAVGGIIVAAADNETGMVGIAPEAKLLPIKACWQLESPENSAKCNSVTIALALDFSINEQVDVINLSLTGPPDLLLERLVDQALAKNIVVVGAKPDHDRPAFPISIDGTIAVSIPGKNSGYLSAPGSRVLSTRPDQRYDFYDGSSFSTAHISGLAAVLRSLSPQLSPSELLALLQNTADPETGEVNACRAVNAVRLRGDESIKLESC